MDSRGTGPVDAENNLFKNNARTVELRGHRKQVQAVRWSGDGRKLASCSTDWNVRIWLLENGSFNFKKTQELTGHKSTCNQIAWDPTHHEKVTSIGSDGYIKVWDVRSGKCVQDLNVGSSSECINVAYRPDGTHLAVGDKKDVIKFIDVRKFKVLETREWTYEVNEFMWNKAGSLFLVVTGLGTVDVFSYPSLAQVDTVTAHVGTLYAIAGDKAGKHMAIAGEDGLVSIWDLSEMICLRTITEHESIIRSIDFSPDEKYIASGGDQFVLVSEVDTAKSVYKIPTVGNNRIHHHAWHPTENLIAYSVSDISVISVFGFPGQPTPQESRIEHRGDNRMDRMEINYPPRPNYMGYGRPSYF